MKRAVSLILILSMLLGAVLSLNSCDVILSLVSGKCDGDNHVDNDDNDRCDVCNEYLIVVIDFYAINDLHGKFCDTEDQPGVDELASYLKLMEMSDENTVFLSTGDMWQGSAESNLTGGKILTEWMNSVGFVSMTLGNHEFDWGQDAIRENHEIAEFPFLAINVYDTKTGELADYCTPSVMIERDGIKIGIIGAVGDCYSSISSDKVQGVEFKVRSELAQLVHNESVRLRAEGADLIVYSLHDGYESNSNGTSIVTDSALRGYYEPFLSNGDVDLVFEAHTHRSYVLRDSHGVYHIQGGGENDGISHVELSINSANGKKRINDANIIRTSAYSELSDDPATEQIEEKYSDIIDMSYGKLGTVSKYYDDYVLEEFVAQLYLEAGIEKWGSEYDIILGGGFLRTRSPYNLSKGDTTYADVLSLLPFDNELVLCSISGSKLKSQFIYTTSSDYHSAYSQYGNSVLNSISDTDIYYVVVDTYTAFYLWNGLKIIEYYDYTTFARDLVAQAIKDGRL